MGLRTGILIFDDADVDRAARLSVAGKFRNAGQVCVSPTRFYVQEGVFGKFLHAFTEHTKAIKVGNGLSSGVTMGPLINAAAVRKVEGLVKRAVAEGQHGPADLRGDADRSRHDAGVR